MPSLLDIRRRIRSVRNTQQLTKAMKTVSAAKLRRAQERVLSARPYAQQLQSVLGDIARKVEGVTHPLLERRDEKRVLLIVITADRGLCGAFNPNILRAVYSFLASHQGRPIQIIPVGRKSRDFFRRRNLPILAEFVNIFGRLDYGVARDIAQVAIQAYSSNETDAVYLAYNEFKSIIQQRIVVEPFLPLAQSEFVSGHAVDFIFEQPPQQLFDVLLPRYVETQVYRALLESAAAEHGARMAAMDSATRNAGEMIEGLTLNMNRVRQAAITREIIEVVSGAGAT